MESCISSAKQIIDKQIRGNMPLLAIHFSEFERCYAWTNENVNGYLSLVDFENKTKALSVLASGDQMFNLITNGVTKVDTFDINRLTEYYALGLKRAMILKYSYEEFNILIPHLISNKMPIEQLSDIIRSLLPYMETKHKKFWEELIDYNYIVQKENQTNISLIRMLCINNAFKYRNSINNYLADKESYEVLRSRLASAEITFKWADAANLDGEFQGKYDFILLSNILDYFNIVYGKNWTYDKLQAYEDRLSKMVNPDGIIFLDYIFDYPIFLEDPIIDGSGITASNLKNGEETILLPNTPYNYGEAIILKRVK